MSPDIQELRRLAEAARHSNSVSLKHEKFRAAASPDTILALVEENERLAEAVKRQEEELSVLRRLAPEYFQWPGKDGVNTAPEWLQHRLKYGGANADGDMLAVYDWLDRRSLAAPGDYVVDGEKGLFVMPARAALKETTDV